MQQRILEQVAKFTKKPIDKIELTDSLVQDLGFDSLDLIELSLALEDETQISIPDDELNKIKTVQDIIDIAEKYTK